ncbi:hypothetical protein GCE9029_01883 [Grimontia celer]|uniref:Lipoprotein n=1 Tax=Grimontia celer TaxID=1796497 RepID=A0A128F142_9GAMM|nr:hypothetical protein [Grimontia celer]CZF80150.1 hypothetical protein GCE9029_01883 [Grimontia celer]
MKINSIEKAALVAASLFLMAGCSYRPPLVEANIPLISHTTKTVTEETCLAGIPDQLLVGEALTIACSQPETYVVADIYKSAMGNRCAVLLATEKELTLCAYTDTRNETLWFKVQSVLSGM